MVASSQKGSLLLRPEKYLEIQSEQDQLGTAITKKHLIPDDFTFISLVDVSN